MRILVADDEDLVRTVVVRLLEFLGHEVMEVNSGEAAFSALQEHGDIELALLDEQMPGLLGSEVLEKLRAFRPKMPVLLSSGNGAIDSPDPHVIVLSKPYRLDNLESALAKVAKQS